MHTLTINIKDNSLLEKFLWLLDHFKQEKGIEILIDKDAKDLQLIKKTRDEESISFEEYLKNENRA